MHLASPLSDTVSECAQNNSRKVNFFFSLKKLSNYQRRRQLTLPFLLRFSLADVKKDEGNELYKTKNYREALQRYSEAISEYSSMEDKYFSSAPYHPSSIRSLAQ